MARNRGENVPGTIYTLHFFPHYRHAGHYTGWAIQGGLFRRLAEHRTGSHSSSPLIRALLNAGGSFVVGDLRPGTRNDERRLKNEGHPERRCLHCQKEGARCA